MIPKGYWRWQEGMVVRKGFRSVCLQAAELAAFAFGCGVGEINGLFISHPAMGLP